MDVYGRVGLSFTVTKRIEVFYMKQFEKWRSLCITGLALGLILSILLFLKKEYIYMIAALIVWIVFICAFLSIALSFDIAVEPP